MLHPTWLIPEWPVAGVGALMTTRQGGVSAAPFDTMNLGATAGDDPAHVMNNRKMLAQASGVPFKLLRQRNAGSSPALAAVRIAGVAARQGCAAGWQASTQFLALTSRHHHEREDCMRTCLLSSALPALHKQTDSSPRSTLGSRRSPSGSYLL
mgnify:CR=1 FL=1